MTAPVSTTTIATKTAVSDELIVNRDGSTAVQSTSDLAFQLATSWPLQISGNAGKLFETYADLAATPHGEFTPWVFADPDPNKNGIYRPSGAGWLWSLPLPLSFLIASNVGAGTPSAIKASTLSPVSTAALILLPIAVEFAGDAVTVSFNGGPALAIKSSTGADVTRLASGSFVIGVVSGATFRLANDEAVTRLIYEAKDAAEAAAALSNAEHLAARNERLQAEAARNAAAGFIDDMVSEKEVPIYATVIGMPSVNVPTGMSVITVRGRFLIHDDDGGLYGLGNNGTPDKFTSGDGRTWYKLRKNPIILAFSGQSNIANVRTGYNWTPQTNAYIWNSTGVAVGTAFTSLNATMISFPAAVTNEIARLNPRREVFAIVGGRPNTPIAGWMAERPLPEGVEDVYALTKARIEAALAALGAIEISRFFWWQGESDAATPASYLANFETVMTRFQAEAWFPLETVTTIMGVVPTVVNGNGIYSAMNITLQKCASADPQRRSFVYTGGCLPASDWLDALHPTANGYYRIGTLTARIVHAGSAGYAGNGLWREPETGNYGLGPHSTAGQLLDVRRDADTPAMVRTANLNAGNSADTGFLALSAHGSLDVRAYGATQVGRAQIAWSGVGSLDIKANNAAGGLRFFVGSASENMRLTATGLNLLSGSLFLNSQQVLKQPITGWQTPTGIKTRTNFDPATVTLPELAAQVNALKSDLHAGSSGHGLIRS
ncbi:sialate O-acetylesterase [Agrobacterium pusense]|uniref:Sialate O-acetylesterase domain-containing protein n=1 Tax=Agrobacterium pusense TaxID=648995 RepID=A0AA44J1V0_9HYPH|nr:sialate O-acetylesterase [Agrobacterium pusense]NRF12174.1 hypothetical protein [Agrobacterium pusense]NRF22884.1 hypothetical protein [Agrobacterium pusense]